MSHQTGIKATSDLISFIKKANDGSIRVIKIKVQDEKIVLSGSQPTNGTFEQDYDKCIDLLLIKEDEACYILMRSDEKSDTSQYMWVLIMYTPDRSSVRYKMLYAATKSTLKQDTVGSSNISQEIHATNKFDISLEGYRKHLHAANACAPLTDAEKIKKDIKKMEVSHGVDSKTETLPGLFFPVESQVKEAFEKLTKTTADVNYVELIVDHVNEIIKLSEVGNRKYDELAGLTSKEPRYHFIKFSHKYEGQDLDSYIFIYTMPGYACSVKDRMMYSSCKNPLITFFESNYAPVDKKLEEENLSSINETTLFNELHPPPVELKKAFAKPKKPSRR